GPPCPTQSNLSSRFPRIVHVEVSDQSVCRVELVAITLEDYPADGFPRTERTVQSCGRCRGARGDATPPTPPERNRGGVLFDPFAALARDGASARRQGRGRLTLGVPRHRSVGRVQ